MRPIPLFHRPTGFRLWSSHSTSRGHQDIAQQIETLIQSRAAAPAFRMEETVLYRVQKPDGQLEEESNHQDAPDAEATAADILDADEWQTQN